MNTYTQNKQTEQRIRASIQYARWVEQNRLTSCIRCNSTDNLHVHHLIELHHVIHGLWKFYGDWELVFQHAVSMHDDNRCEGVTLCEKCHSGLHPGRTSIKANEKVHVADWCVIPRNLNARFALGAKGREKGEIGLLGFQALFGIGWNILNGYGGQILTFNWRRMADLLDKTPGVSFANGLALALNSLVEVGYLSAWVRTGNDFEVHLGKNYVQELESNPWFMPLKDVRTSRMSTLVLRWLMSCQSNKPCYTIGREKLATHMQIGTRTPSFITKCVTEASQGTDWLEMEDDGKNFKFRFKARGLIPIHSLRPLLSNGLNS